MAQNRLCGSLLTGCRWGSRQGLVPGKLGKLVGLDGNLASLGGDVGVEMSAATLGPWLASGGLTISPIDCSSSTPLRCLPTCGLQPRLSPRPWA